MANIPAMYPRVGSKPTQDYLKLSAIARDYYRDLAGALIDLADLIQFQDAALPAYCSRIIQYHLEDSSPTRIEVKSLEGVEARVAAADIICALTNAHDLPIGRVCRLPGVIAASDAVLEHVNHVNVLKHSFQEKVIAISPVRQIRRREIQRAVGKNINMVQCCRSIQIIDFIFEGISFTWSSRSMVSRTMKVAEAMMLVSQSRDYPPPEYVDPTTWDNHATATLNRLEQFPQDEIISYRESIPPHPRVNIQMPNSRRTMKTVSIPLVYPWSGRKAPPVIKQLAPLNAMKVSQPRGEPTYEEEPISSTFGLYRRTVEARSIDP